ncbi:hypothetical protein [Mycobacterium sp. OTB74]|jgi:hypothetical protein|uniref:hypothetical protein n=1 Tax=Mycobacterium sp. OTB74 TaxID=1853452 RepID=UPI002474505A|nr:hypothetical protein [Mycobacterium sp. OTB74]MDH6248011.1 hypothetical protein [Mycobacterium sp. OTB74]
MNRDELSDTELDLAFRHGQSLMHADADNVLSPLRPLDAETLLLLCTELAERTGTGDTVRDMLRNALALACGTAVATRAALDEGSPVLVLHAECVKRWALARGALLCDQIDETTARADAAGV